MVDDRIDVYRDMISALALDAQNDAKGSAGDKHETALSMMHLEQEKISAKLRESIDHRAVLEKVLGHVPSGRVGLGSLVRSNGMWFLVSAALPKITVEGQVVFAVSPQSPLGAAMVGKTVGDSAQAAGKAYAIDEIL